MTIELLLFVLVCAIFIWVSYNINGRILNIPTVFFAPYVFIIIINNYVMSRYGFYEISTDTINMLLIAAFFVSIGSILADIIRKKRSNVHLYYEQSDEKFNYYKFKKMLWYVIVVEAITIIRFLLTLFSEGAIYVVSDAYESGLLRGPLGHLFLTIYPLLPLLFYYWLKHRKDWLYLFASCFGLCLFFLTFVKYHSIGLVVITFFFVSLEDRKYFKKGLFLVLGLAVGFFVLNYFVSFTARGTTGLLKENYYLEHLWNYIAGSLIYDNYIFTLGVRPGVSVLYKLMSFIMTPLNLVLNKLGFEMICPHIALPFLSVGLNGERGNVVDAFGYLYPSHGNIFDYAFYIVALVFIGFAFTCIYNKGLKLKKKYAISLSIFLSMFVFFSFFGTFYVSIVPYEMLLWSTVMLKIFDKRFKVKIR